MEIMIESRLIGKPTFVETGSESLSLSDVKAHLYIESGNSDFNARLTALITEVRQYLEEISGRSLIRKTVTQVVDYETSFSIPYPPLVSFTSASIKTDIGTYEAEVVDEDYEVEGERFISYTGAWRYRLIYEAGYTSATLPPGLKLAWLNEIARRFEHRGDRTIISDTNELLKPYVDVA